MDSIRLAEFVGLPSALGWSHVTTLAIPSGADGVICFAVSGSQSSAVGHELVAVLRSHQLISEQDLYDLVISLNAKTQERSCRLSIVAGFLENGRGSWITYGGVVGLQRNGRFGRVLTSTDLQMRTGTMQPNDIFVLATTAAAGILDDVSELFGQGYQLAGVESSLERLIRTQPQQDLSALALVETFSDQEMQDQVRQQRGDQAPPWDRNQNQDQSDDSGQEKSGEQDPIRSLEDVAVLHVAERLENTPQVQETQESQETQRPLAGQSRGLELEHEQTLPPSHQPALQTESVSAAARRRASIRSALGRLGKKVALVVPFVRRLAQRVQQGGAWVGAGVMRVVRASQRAVTQLPWRAWRDSKRVRLTVSIVLVVIVVAVAAIGTVVWQRRQADSQAQTVIAPFRTQLAQIQAQAASDPLRAQSSLVELTAAVNDQLDTSPAKSTATALQHFLAEVRGYQDVLKGEQAIRSLPVFMDLQTVVPGFVASIADGLPGSGIYVDHAKKIAVLVRFDTQEVRQFDLSAMETIRAISFSTPDTAVILGEGIYTLDLANSEATPVLAKPVGDSNREANLISSYDSYVYIFNPEKRNIFRYLVRSTGYSDPIGWLLSPLGVPSDMVHSMEVDGDVWLSTKDGQIKKFTSGRVTGFSLTNLEQPFEGPLQIHTNEQDQYLYVFAPTQQRVVVLTKDGIFVKQIKSEILSGALSVTANEPAGKLFAISGSVIYQAAL